MCNVLVWRLSQNCHTSWHRIMTLGHVTFLWHWYRYTSRFPVTPPPSSAIIGDHSIVFYPMRPVIIHTVSGWEPCSVRVINILLKHWHQQKVHHVVNKNKAFYGDTRNETFLPHPHLVTIAMNRIWFNDTIMNPEEKSKYLVVICHSKVYQTKKKAQTCPPSKNWNAI